MHVAVSIDGCQRNSWPNLQFGALVSPQSRLIGTVFATLRVGHATVSDHLYRIGKRTY